jgi:hypothetical protein
MTEFTSAERAAAEVIRNFPWHNFGLNEVDLTIRRFPGQQEWIPALARKVAGAVLGCAEPEHCPDFPDCVEGMVRPRRLGVTQGG